jgi:ubiquitin carboxyl-terminal hydrolase L5
MTSRKPVHGLIFLYQYIEEDAQEPTENGGKVWFANQVGLCFHCLM